MRDKAPETPPPIEGDAWPESTAYLRGVQLFNAGYYWEAHEAWESLWHAHGRRGPIATVLKGLIKLAAAGVKIREGRADGVRTLATRAAGHFAEAAEEGSRRLGLDLEEWIKHAQEIAAAPPQSRGTTEAPGPLFPFRLEPHRPF
jgi:predicted metal-dependent hydrolase